MYTATLHFESHMGVDDLRIKAETLEELRQTAEAEVIRRKPEAHWSSDVRKDGKPVQVGCEGCEGMSTTHSCRDWRELEPVLEGTSQND